MPPRDRFRSPVIDGQPLSVLPLWLTGDLAVSLHLEASYRQTFRDPRIG